MRMDKSNASHQKGTTTGDSAAIVRGHGPTLLTDRELELVAAAGGRGGLGGEVRL
jgi:hypothetical protein